MNTAHVYRYGPYRERRFFRIAFERLRFLAINLFYFQWRAVLLGLTQKICVLQSMTQEEFKDNCVSLFPHRRINYRFFRRTGKDLLLIIYVKK